MNKKITKIQITEFDLLDKNWTDRQIDLLGKPGKNQCWSQTKFFETMNNPFWQQIQGRKLLRLEKKMNKKRRKK